MVYTNNVLKRNGIFVGSVILLAAFLNACGGGGSSSDNNSGGGGEACVDKGTLSLDTPVTDNALTDLAGHCYTVALSANVHYTFTLSVSTPLGTNVDIIHDDTDDSIVNFGANQGAPGTIVVEFPETRNYLLEVNGDGYTLDVSLGGSFDTTNVTTLTGLSGPANVTNGRAMNLDVEFLLDGGSQGATFSFTDGKDPVVDDMVNNLNLSAEVGFAAAGNPLSRTAVFETKGDPTATAGTVSFNYLTVSGTSSGADSVYELGAWPTTVYTGYVLRQFGGNSTPYYGLARSLAAPSVSINNPPSEISCVPATLSGTLTMPSSFTVGDSIAVTVPIATSSAAAITVTLTDAIGHTAGASITGAVSGSNLVTVHTSGSLLDSGEEITVSVNTTLDSEFTCKASYAGTSTGNYVESQYDSITLERYLIDTSFAVSTITSL